jgi:hypothetical protein
MVWYGGSYQQRKQNQADVLAQIAEHKRLAEMERRRQARDWRLAQQAEALYVQRVRTCCEHAAACARAAGHMRRSLRETHVLQVEVELAKGGGGERNAAKKSAKLN